ncbi:hypothetical protein [Cloacibacterium caeni]|uniref:hypothetical protein n=1 Tax=Cloacibacterium caeni TaxID=2004710 RepID=UPI001BCE45E5|nr:hypothetical protein [Cloacibacterium caeni]
MADLDLLHFEQLKAEVQAEYLKNHHPSYDEISKWKGIDIIYFQEDLRKKAKGNISEKSFYTYFKTSPSSKLPRIDMLNLLATYAGYQSWYDFKKNHLFANEIISEHEKPSEILIADEENIETYTEKQAETVISTPEKVIPFIEKTTTAEIQPSLEEIKTTVATSSSPQRIFKNPLISLIKQYFWLISSVVLMTMVLILVFWQRIFATDYKFTFIDADRNTKIKDIIEIRVLKENETPIRYIINSGKDIEDDDVGVFRFPTQSKTLAMEVNSPFYRKDTIYRNLDPARTNETIELEPDVYAQALYYYSTNDISKKREELDKIISNNALIYQVFDNETYGVETLDKQKYIGLVTTPTTSLKNFKMIETKVSPETKKIILIKFKIQPDEITK